MTIQADGYEFDFPKAVELIKFDERDNTYPSYHQVKEMQAVDVIAEFEDCYLFIEIKERSKFNQKKMLEAQSLKKEKRQHESVDSLREDLVGKYKDSFLYRYAEKNINKPIRYICLMNLDKIIADRFSIELKKYLRYGKKAPKTWNRSFISSVVVTDIHGWNRNEKLSNLGSCKKL